MRKGAPGHPKAGGKQICTLANLCEFYIGLMRGSGGEGRGGGGSGERESSSPEYLKPIILSAWLAQAGGAPGHPCGSGAARPPRGPRLAQHTGWDSCCNSRETGDHTHSVPPKDT